MLWFCILLLSWGNYGQVCVEEKNWQDLGINPQERGRLFWYHATCYSATQEDCPADMCFWDEAVGKCFILQAVFDVIDEINFCDFYHVTLQDMTVQNTQPWTGGGGGGNGRRNLQGGPGGRDLTPDQLREMAEVWGGCYDIDNFLSNRLGRTSANPITCAEYVDGDEQRCWINFPNNPPRMPLSPGDWIPMQVMCCASCGKVMAQDQGEPTAENPNFARYPRNYTNYMPAECVGYDPFCFDIIEGCEYIVQHDLCLLVTGCDSTCGACGECADQFGPQTCGILRSQFDPDCTTTQIDTCQDSCRACPNRAGQCDVMQQVVKITDFSDVIDMYVPSLGATFGPIAMDPDSFQLFIQKDTNLDMCTTPEARYFTEDDDTSYALLAWRGGCSFETKTRNAEIAGAQYLLVMNNHQDADLIFMNADSTTMTSNFTTVTSRFIEYNPILASYMNDTSAMSGITYVSIECFDDYSPPHLCIRGTDNARFDGQYAIAGSYNGKVYWTTKRNNSNIYIFWNNRWRIGGSLSDVNNEMQQIVCTTRQEEGEGEGPPVNGIMDCDEWIWRGNQGQYVLSDFSLRRRRCGNECDFDMLSGYAKRVNDELGDNACLQFMAFRAQQDTWACRCFEALNELGIDIVDELHCTFGTVKIANTWLNCNTYEGSLSTAVQMHVSVYPKGDRCLSNVAEQSEDKFASSDSCDSYLIYDFDNPDNVYQWSNEYFCDFDQKQVGVIIYPHSYTCGGDGSEEQIWFYINETSSDGCNTFSFDGHWDQTYIDAYLEIREFRVTDHGCGQVYIPTTTAPSDAILFSLSMALLTAMALI